MDTLLVVGRDQNVLGRISWTLKEAGYETCVRGSVTEACETLRQIEVSLILVEEELPDLSAKDLLRMRNEDSALGNVAVVVWGSGNKKAVEYYRLGADGYIALPYELEELSFRVRLALKRTSSDCLVGQFSYFSIFDLIQMLLNAQSSGNLSIETEKGRGSLCFDKGMVYFAQTEELFGEDAFRQLVIDSQLGGRFYFHTHTTKSNEANITARTEHLLLGFAHSIDESEV